MFRAESEELFRFALEKTTIDIVFGQELINPKDSLHFPRGGLDQITCKIAKEKEKTIAFSFSDILGSGNKGRLLGRIRFNLQLCRKYKVKMLFSNFSENGSVGDDMLMFKSFSFCRSIIFESYNLQNVLCRLLYISGFFSSHSSLSISSYFLYIT